MSPLIVAAVALALAVAALVRSRQLTRKRRAAQRAAWGRAPERERPMARIAGQHQALAAQGSSGSIDERTWADLHLDEVFAALDHTVSPVGQQALYHRLRGVGRRDADLEAFDALATLLGGDAAVREGVQGGLGRLTDPSAYDLWWLAQPGVLVRHRWHVIFPTAAALMLAAIAVIPFWPGALLVVIAGAAVNLAIRIAIGPRLGLLGAFRQIAPLLAAAEGLARVLGPDAGPWLESLVADSARLGRLKGIARWSARDALSASEPLGAIAEYLNLLFLLDANALYFGVREVERHGGALRRLVLTVGEIDAALATASMRAGSDAWTRPGFRPAGACADLTEVRHPLVADAVPTTVRLEPGRGILVTGSNMSGKSTFVRGLGVNVVLAQSLATVFARSYDAPVLAVRSAMGGQDDLLAGKSYYLAEVESILALVKDSQQRAPCLFLLDELFRGTNAVERIAAAEAVLAALVGSPAGGPHFVVAATHDGELVHLLGERYDTWHFSGGVDDAGLTFDYRLRPGPATTRNAIALLRLHGAPTPLVERAAARAAALEEARDATR